MMRATAIRFLTGAILALSLGTAAAAQGQPGPEPDARSAGWIGTWANMNNTLHIKTSRCGEDVCGVVIWANDKAKADVAEKGRTLVGAQLFRNFEQTGPNQWAGKVYVPDIDRTVSGKVTLTDRDSITAVGCLFGPFGCQTRHWKRIR
jgi:uncharacterized protein (DUF2147 family)